MYKEAIDIVTKYIEEAVNGAKGNVVSVSVKQINRWYEKRFGRPMPRRIVFRVVKVLRILYTLGALTKIGNKFVLEKSSQLWKCAKENRVRECISDYVTKFAELVEVA